MADPSGLAGDPTYLSPDQALALTRSGVPLDVVRAMVRQPTYGEGERRSGSWPYQRGGREYQPGANVMPDLPQPPFVSPSLPGNSTQATLAGMGSPSLQNMSPQDIARMRLMMQILGNRGPAGMAQNPFGGGMQFGQNAPGGQMANQLAQGGMNPQMLQLLQYYLQNQQGGGMQGGAYPQSGGGVDLGAMMQALGFPAGGASR